MNAALILVVCYFALCAEQITSFQCLSQTGAPVEWFIVYKLPILPKTNDMMLRNGRGYYYMDTGDTSLSLSKNGIDSTKENPLFNTLQQIYKPPTQQFMYAFYNDQPPPKGDAPSKYGHMKGVVGFDKTEGFWLVHSTPRYPPKRSDGYSWPESAKRNGQTFICMSSAFKMMNEIGKQLIYDYPKVYEYSMPQDFVKLAPDMGKVLNTNQAQKESSPWQNMIPFTSKTGIKFASFAKSKEFNQDLYDSFVAPELKESLFVQTWRQDLDPYCNGKYKVMKIEQVRFPKEKEYIIVEATKDHSKWAVSEKGDWTCIGDINRALSQFKRGGGTLCIDNVAVSNQFRALIYKKVECK